MSIFDKLNTPRAVIAILVIIVAVNGFLLFQQRDPQNSTPTETASNKPTTSESTSTDESPGVVASGEETSSRETSDESASNAQEETTQVEETSEAQQGDDGSGEERAEPGQPAPDDEQQEPEQQSPPPEDNQNDEPETLLADLSVALDDCDGSTGECVREYFADNVPDSRFIGGRVNLSAAPDDANEEVLYFESPGLDVCEFERERYESGDGQDYTVILIGEGSVQSQEGNECIPTA